MKLRSLLLLAPAAGALVLAASGCSLSPARTGSGGDHLSVVAAENFWGSIAAQLGGTKVTVHSIVSNPATDPHDYEPTPGDAVSVARAGMVIYNGIGYDPWAPKLLAADPQNGRAVLCVGDLVGIRPGGNPHRWYSPTDVSQVIDAMTADYEHALPRDASYFAHRRATFLSSGLARYHALIAAIRARYAGVPVGASESIFVPMAQALGLDLLTPETFLDAIREGGEPTAADKATIDSQLRTGAIEVYVFNNQNATPDVRSQVNEARARGIPVTPITETLVPASATFQAWQVGELEALQAALARATGR